MNESISEFETNFKTIKSEKKEFKLVQIDKYLSPSKSQTSTSAVKKEQEPPEQQRQQSNPTTSESKPKPKLALNKLDKTIKLSRTKSASNCSKPSSSETSTISKYFQSPTTNASQEQQPEAVVAEFNCPLCSISLSHMSEPDRQKHVNSCLDTRFSSNSAKTSSDSKPVHKIKPMPAVSSSSSSSSAAASVPPTTSCAEVKAEQAGRSKQASVEVKDEEDTKSVERSVETILKDMVPNCPICGKVLQSANVIAYWYSYSYLSSSSFSFY